MRDRTERITARATYVGARIDTRHLEKGDVLALSPLAVRAGEKGSAFLFRFGGVVFVDVAPVEQAKFLDDLRPFLKDPIDEIEAESVDVIVGGDNDRIDADGVICLHDASIPRLQILAEVLAKSTVLAHFEELVMKVFGRVENMARSLGAGGRPSQGKNLLQEIGQVLLIQVHTVGRVEVAEKPEAAWDNPELDRLYERLAIEFELRERDKALSRKLDLISRTAETYLELLHNRRSLRVEWYIVILILVEILLISYELFWAPG